jgi:DNA polymerase/3'-5' exonuclease PolX
MSGYDSCKEKHITPQGQKVEEQHERAQLPATLAIVRFAGYIVETFQAFDW